MTDPQLFELIGRADPMTDEAAPTVDDTEAALRTLLARPPRREPPRPRRPRHVLPLGAAAIAAAALVFFAVINVVPAGRPGTVPTASAAAVIRHALTALTPRSGTVLHVVLRLTQVTPDATVHLKQESWQQDSAPYARRLITTGPPGTVTETLTVGRREQIYDRGTDTIFADRATSTVLPYRVHRGPKTGTYVLHIEGSHPTTITMSPALIKAVRDGTISVGVGSSSAAPVSAVAGEGRSTAQAFRARAVAMMRARGVRVDQHASFEGRPAIRISSARDVLYLDPRTYGPIELRSTAGFGGVRFPIYRVLTGAGARKLLSLTAQHPGARVEPFLPELRDALRHVDHPLG